MLHVVGTRHHYQFGAGTRFGQDQCTESDENAFALMLRKLFTSVVAEVFAEELNHQALEEIGNSSSVIQRLAAELSISHIFCDPDRKERFHLGIKNETEIRISAFPKTIDEEIVQTLLVESWRCREQEWLRRLDPAKSKTVIFVCGANHIATFVPLAHEQGFECKVVHASWEA